MNDNVKNHRYRLRENNTSALAAVIKAISPSLWGSNLQVAIRFYKEGLIGYIPSVLPPKRNKLQKENLPQAWLREWFIEALSSFPSLIWNQNKKSRRLFAAGPRNKEVRNKWWVEQRSCFIYNMCRGNEKSGNLHRTSMLGKPNPAHSKECKAWATP